MTIYNNLANKSSGISTNGNTLAHIKQYMPGAILIPTERRMKKPLGVWKHITFADTQKAAYQTKLNLAIKKRGNICVRFGECSGGLVSIDIDSDEKVAEFLVLNPKFQNTLRIKARRGCQFYIYLTGNFPKKKGVEPNKWGELRVGANGRCAQSVIWGEHEVEGIFYDWIMDVPPMIISWEEIIWPPAWVLSWDKKVKSADNEKFQQWGKDRFDWELSNLDYRGLLTHVKIPFQAKEDEDRPNMVTFRCLREKAHKNSNADTDMAFWGGEGGDPYMLLLSYNLRNGSNDCPRDPRGEGAGGCQVVLYSKASASV